MGKILYQVWGTLICVFLYQGNRILHHSAHGFPGFLHCRPPLMPCELTPFCPCCPDPALTCPGAEIPQFWCLHPPSVFPWPCRCGADPAVCDSAVSSCSGRWLELGAGQGSLQLENKGLENLEAITQENNQSICCKASCHLFKPDLIAVKRNIHLLYSLWCSCVCCSVYLNERQISY